MVLSDRTIAARIGIIPLYKACTLIMGLSFGLWAVSNSYGWLVVFALVMGSSYGGMIALSPAVVAELFGVQGLGAQRDRTHASFVLAFVQANLALD